MNTLSKVESTCRPPEKRVLQGLQRQTQGQRLPEEMDALGLDEQLEETGAQQLAASKGGRVRPFPGVLAPRFENAPGAHQLHAGAGVGAARTHRRQEIEPGQPEDRSGEALPASLVVQV